ncbi:MAG: hypothetical protein LBS01_08865 [Prevotellaceae bacterium]|nr:hypothetical protein [Prevotellaceae bacterium]
MLQSTKDTKKSLLSRFSGTSSLGRIPFAPTGALRTGVWHTPPFSSGRMPLF